MSVTIEPAEIESHYQQYVRGGADEASMAEVLLGDPSYVKRFRMPKYNGPVNMLREPNVAIRHMNELGIPGSKTAHRERASYFQDLRAALDTAWQDLVNRCVRMFGGGGPLISGVYRGHFPDAAKDRLRFLSHGATMATDAERLHHTLTKTRSPRFTR